MSGGQRLDAGDGEEGQKGGEGDASRRPYESAGEMQLIPPGITGKGSSGAGSGASVLDHAFGKSDPYTLGVEEEYQLLDGTTFDLVQHIDTVLAAIAGHELEPQINPELMQSVLEIATPVCHTPADVMGELTKLRGYVCNVARTNGMRLGSAGTHPFSLFERQRITAKDRYRQLVDQLQYIARRELIFGMHIHVAIDGPDKAIKVMNGLLPQLAPLLALSASSPFWRGEPTGLMSSRQMVFSSFPRSGPPPRFRDYADYAEVVGQLERTGCIADYTHIWWDIRPHPRLGTIEIRICDAVTRVEDAVAITAYCQALVKQLSEKHDAGEEIASYHRILTTENKWLAARYGLDAPVMDLATGRRNRIPVAQLVRRTVRELEPHARELGSERELEGISELLARGEQRRPAAPDLQREPRHPRGGRGDRDRDRDAAGRCGLMLQPGDRVPAARVWKAPREGPSRAGGGARRPGFWRSSASTPSTGRPAARTRPCSSASGSPSSTPQGSGRSGSRAIHPGRTQRGS